MPPPDWDYVADTQLRADLEALPIEQQEAMHGLHPDLLQRRLTDNAVATAIALAGPDLTPEEKAMSSEDFLASLVQPPGGRQD